MMLQLVTAILFLSVDDQYLGRLEYSNMSQQALMELTAEKIYEKSKIMDSSDQFLEISEWPGLEFDYCGDVVRVHWGYDDAFARVCTDGSIKLEWLPSSVQEINISGCNFQEVNFSVLPQNIRSFEGMSNRFYGSVETADFPRTLQSLCLDLCELSGPLDLSQLSNAMISFGVAMNSLCGSINLRDLPENIQEISLSKNLFTGSLDMRYLPEKLKVLKVDGNMLSGSVDLARLTNSLEELDISCNSLSGSVKWQHLPDRMQELYIQENSFSGSFKLHFPPNMVYMYAFDNGFSGTAQVSEIPIYLRSLDLRNGKMKGVTDANFRSIEDQRILVVGIYGDSDDSEGTSDDFDDCGYDQSETDESDSTYDSADAYTSDE